MKRLLLPLFAAFALTACGTQQDTALPADTEQAPALWAINGPDGAVEGWLFGTIHALPDDFAWRTPMLDSTLKSADMLVVEVAALDDGAALSQLFEDMAFDRPAGPIIDRIDPQYRDEFDALLVKAKVRRSYFDPMESWAAALALAQVAQSAKSANGVDRALLTSFKGREVVELEGAKAQLAIFDSLPEKEQRDLLNAVLDETASYEDEIGELARTWQTGDTAKLGELTKRGILADKELKQVLLVQRNQAWAAQIENLLSASQRPFVAVGAGHLLGPEGLPKLLEQRGYTVERVE
ncbi:TraB/GumN family protein [Qipengyuania marisflavi]|nr:TraB/GumN family protein [Qipengyuania marisflavi]